MIQAVEVRPRLTLDDYASYAHLAALVGQFRDEASHLVHRLEGRKIWMVNSTARGGGVAEMLPGVISLLREVGLPAEWMVIDSDRPEFFELTKRLHNLIHGEGDPALSAEDRELYDHVSEENADAFEKLLDPEDLLVVHDPQPMGMGALLKRRVGLRTIWRCHIGVDERVAATRAVWRFLEPYGMEYDHAVFTAPEYIPDYLARRTSLITPAIDPVCDKNRQLSIQALVGVLWNAGLAVPHGPVLDPGFSERAERLDRSGDFGAATHPEDLGLLSRPIVSQVSRWDRLKGYAPLMEAFARLKRRVREGVDGIDPRHHRRLELLRMVLAGPDPASVQDDPEAREVLEELRARYLELEPEIQEDLAMISLPMGSTGNNALMVNALQRCSSLVVQNSLREGFGLTATEAMWKHVPVLGTHAVGLRLQIRDGLDGRLSEDPNDPEELAEILQQMLVDPDTLDLWGRNAQRRVHKRFLIFTQVLHWLRVLATCAESPAKEPSTGS